MTILSYLATIFGIFMALSNFLQAYRIFKRKSAKDISIITFSIFFIGAIIWVLYGIDIKNLPIIIANSIGVLGVLLVIIGWFLYGRKKK